MHERRVPQEDPGQRRRLDKEQRTATLKIAAGLGIVLLFVLFVVQNLERVTVDFVFFEKRIRLIWVFLACALIGSLATWLVGRPRRRAMKRLVEELERKQEDD